jgi:hypothetical protein
VVGIRINEGCMAPGPGEIVLKKVRIVSYDL